MTQQARVLLVTHALGGGIERHISDLRALLSATVEIEVLRPAGKHAVRLEQDGSAPIVWGSDDWPRLLDALRRRGYQRIHLHHVHGFPPAILDLPAALQLPYDLTLHDFYPICPIYSLSAPDGSYCGEPDVTGCQACISGRPHQWGWPIDTWRAAMRGFLARAARVIVPSAYVAERIGRHFPEIALDLRSHPPRADWIASPAHRVKVLLLGGLARVKGLEVLLGSAAVARQKNLPLAFCLLGYTEHAIPTWPDLPIQLRGEYDDAQLPALLDLERANVLWFPGQIPESYSYTLDVALASGLPIVASDLGAIGERLRGRADCRLLPANATDDDWNEALLAVARKDADSAAANWPDAAAQQRLRDAYAAFLRLPLAGASSPTRFADADADAALCCELPAGDELPLAALYEHGVECGHRESRLAMKQRIGQIARDYEVLEQYGELAGKPWFEVFEEVERDRAIASQKFHGLEREFQAGRQEWLVAHERQQAEIGKLQTQITHQLEQVGDLRSQLGAQQTQIAEQQTQIADQRTHIAEQRTQIGDQRKLIVDQQTQIADQRCQIGNQQIQIGNQQAQIDDRLRDLEDGRRRYDARGEDLVKAVAQIRKFEASTSWKVTAPLRLVGRATKTSKHSINHAWHQLRRGHQRLPMAMEILRTQGPAALSQRINEKLKGQTYQPVAVAAPVSTEIGTLALASCADNVQPRVSLVIPVYGQHQHTFNCLQSLAAHTALDAVEIIVVDDASPEPAAQALQGVSGIRLVRNQSNLGFIGSCHHGADLARGEFLILLNNDIQVTAGWLEALLAVFVLRPDAGMVGARLVYPDGRLQEAGGIVWQDGSAWNWGRGDDPERPQYRYLRTVDYCSGACLALTLADWQALGGFDRAFMPAYYEDTDLAFRIRANGKRVYYQPEATIIHFEGVSSGTDETQGVKRHQVINRKVFFERWRSILMEHRMNGVEPQREADRGTRARVLVVEACMITPDQDSGSVRMLAMLELLVALGCKVSFVADNLECRQPYARTLQQSGVEVWHYPYIQSVAQLLEETGSNYDMIMFCRHYIAAPYITQIRQWAPQARIVFDTVDLHYLREERQAELEKSPAMEAKSKKTRAQELGVIAKSDVTLVVSPVELELLAREVPGADVRILSNIHEPRPARRSFSQREGLLFVGGFRHPPNIDAMEWFVGEIWSLVRQRLPQLVLTIVGSNMPNHIHTLTGPGVVVAGFVEDIDPLIDAARISLAPLRYGAGVKGKINQAMACGLPVVATSAAAEGMDLQDGLELLVADTAQEFADAIVRLHGDEALWNRLAEGGRDNVRRYFSRATASATLAGLLGLERQLSAGKATAVVSAAEPARVATEA
jgi:GT2 family glycosyltransferase/glycosyltransferase involved in cell wall biosynthesis